jgi:trigger factor
LKIEQIPQEDHQVKLVVEFESTQFEEYKQRAARQLARRVKIPGFRPGKAPYPIIVRNVGEPAIVDEAIELLIDDQYPKVIEESGVNPYGPGSLDKIESLDPLKLEFLVPLQATIELGDYQSVRVPYEPQPVPETEIDEMLVRLRDQNAVSEPVDRPAQEGDSVYIRLSGTRQSADGETAPLISETTVPVIIEPADKDASNEWPYPGFSRELIGLSKGEGKTIQYTYPEDSTYENLRGVKAEFTLQVEEVKSHVLPELNDDFARTVSEFNTLEELREEIRQDLAEMQLRNYHAEYDDKVLEEVAKISTIKYPARMLEHEIDDIISRLKDRLAQQRMDFDLYLKSRGIDEAALREEYKPVALTRLQKSLALIELSMKENIEVKPEELQDEAIKAIDQLNRSLPAAEARKLNQRKVFSGLVGDIMADMIARRTTERLREIASGGAYHSTPAGPVPEGTAEEEHAPAPVEAVADEMAVETATETLAETPAAPIESAASAETTASEPVAEPPKKSKKRSKSKVEE